MVRKTIVLCYSTNHSVHVVFSDLWAACIGSDIYHQIYSHISHCKYKNFLYLNITWPGTRLVHNVHNNESLESKF